MNTQEQHGDWYEIRLQGRLDDRWSAWLDGLDLSRTQDGATVLRGPITDQAALHGLLAKVRDVGLPLVSVTRMDAPTQHPSTAEPAASRSTSPGE